MYVDKDCINTQLLQEQPYFSDYYYSHVRDQTYHVMFGVASDNLFNRDSLVIMDGQVSLSRVTTALLLFGLRSSQLDNGTY